MTPTNVLGLPEPWVAGAAAVFNDYDPGEGTWRSVTELTGPARAAALKHAYPNEQDIPDAAELVNLILGKAVHHVLSQSGVKGIREERLYATVGGQRISGQFDYFSGDSGEIVVLKDDGMLSDYKYTSVYTYLHAVRWRGEKRTRFDEWEPQVNCYAYLATLAGYAVRGVQTIPILDGWSASEYERAAARAAQLDETCRYPATKVFRCPFRLWDMEETQQYLAERVAVHRAAEIQLARGDALMHCTDNERWLSEPTRTEPRVLAKKCLPTRKGYCPMRTYCVGLGDGQHAPGELGEP